MAIIEVAVGLSFLYAILSLVCTSATEGLANIFTLRARMLRLALANLFGESRTGKNTANLLNHPLVSGLWQNRKLKGFIPGLPDYIPSNIYVAALLESVETNDGATNRTRPAALADLTSLVGRISNEPMRRVLQSLIAGAPDLETAQRQIEQYYDNAMERVRGWYARWAQLITFVVSVGIVGGVNADTLMVADVLWRDSALRADIVRLAQKEAKRRATGDTVPQQGSAASSQSSNPNNPGSSGSVQDEQKRGESAEAIALTAERLKAFPLGWTAIDKDPRAVPATAGEAWRKLIGLLVTVLAVSLGAPFWFDLINRFATLRSSGAPPEIKKPDSKDKKQNG